MFKSIRALFAFLVRHARSVRHARALAAVVVLAGVANGAANLVLVAVANDAINDGGGAVAARVWLFVAACALLPLTRFGAEYLLVYLTERATLDLRMGMSRRILAAPLRKLEEIGTPALLATLSGDVTTVIAVVGLLPVFCTNLAVVAGSLVYMGYLSPLLLCGVLVFLVAGVLAYQIPLLRAQKHVQSFRNGMDDLFRHFKAVTEATKELKLHQARRQAFLSQRLERTAGGLVADNLAAQRLFTSAGSWGQLLVFMLVGVIAFVVPERMPVEREVLSGYLLAILFMVSPIQSLMNAVPHLGRAMVSMKKVEALGLALDEATPAVAHLAAPAGALEWRALELVGVTHGYRSEHDRTQFTLGPLHLRFQPGELVVITGGNGSGKTTLAKLLTGLYTPESGELRLDGVPVTPQSLARYQSLFSVVFSDFFLFDTLLGLEEADARALHYLQALQLEHKVRVEDGRLSTTDLSQGQRKRLALLTAYLEDRPIYLFDEWAADQDPHFREVFYHEILPRLREQGKTVFAISHDDRYFAVADRLIKLENGRVVQDSGMLPPGIAIAQAQRPLV
jgi:putative ATP-binding cassette transporter